MFNFSLRLLLVVVAGVASAALAGPVKPLEGCSRAEGQSVRQSLRERAGHQGDNSTFVPWPDLRGAWVNEARGLFVNVRIERQDSRSYWISLEIRRLCEDETLLAAGDILLPGKPSDLNRRNFPHIALRNYGLAGPSFPRAYFSFSNSRPTLRVEGWDSEAEQAVHDRIALQLP